MNELIHENTDFEITSKKPYIPLVIFYIGTFLFLVRRFNTLEIESKFFKTFIILGLIILSSTLLFRFFTTKNKLTIANKTLLLDITHGLPQRIENHTFEFKNIERIILKQTHESKTGSKKIKIYVKEGCHEISVTFRYYQLVQIEEYFNNNTSIDIELIG